MVRTLVVTNDFPPRAGGIQQFVHSFACQFPPGDIVVYAPKWNGAEEFDRAQPFPVVRHPTSLMLPTPGVASQARQIMASEGCETVWFGAMAPLGLLADDLRRAGAQRLIASTHGHETAWAMLPGPRQTLRIIAGRLDHVTYLGAYTRSKLAPAFGPYADRLVQVPPGVDPDVFRPDVDGAAVRSRYGLDGRTVLVCVSRLMARKGQDVLVRAMPAIRERVPGAALLLVGGGPYYDRLVELVQGLGLDSDVVLTRGVPWAELPAHYRAGDVFAMPCRTRNHGLDVEGLGIVYLEASASGLPVVAGDSGGAPDAVQQGRTGYVVDGRDEAAVADRAASLLSDAQARAAMGAAGREWVDREWRWSKLVLRLRALLDPATPSPRDPAV